MKRLRQPNDFYCGPASLAMLASFHGIDLNQDDIVTAAGITKTVKTHGIFLEGMATASQILLPSLQFWYKRDSTLAELSQLINDLLLPVGVEWQGNFEDDDEEEEGESEDSDDDPGHYSVVTGLSTGENWLTLANPYHNKGIDKQFTILEFERRWWDVNEVTDPLSGRHHQVDDYHALFFLTSKDSPPPISNLTQSNV